MSAMEYINLLIMVKEIDGKWKGRKQKRGKVIINMFSTVRCLCSFYYPW
jgi:hypothetical protein